MTMRLSEGLLVRRCAQCQTYHQTNDGSGKSVCNGCSPPTEPEIVEPEAPEPETQIDLTNSSVPPAPDTKGELFGRR